MNVKHSRAERGVALVITLIMLSVVTITVVAFLAVARREKQSVAGASEQEDARLLAETALARAKDYVISRAVQYTNWSAPGYTVSTNFQRPFITTTDLNTSAADYPQFDIYDNVQRANLTNVSYSKDGIGQAWNLTISAEAKYYRAMLANLYYDPRPPVVVQTNRSGSLLARQDFRYFLDLNRNGQFDTNGFIFPVDANDRTNGYAPTWMYGDPEWIGVLEHPDRPHSGNNRFIGRVAYVVVPSSRTLNINYAGNRAGAGKGGTRSFSRNQGIGSWEFNLGGFFRDLNTNVWRNTDYTYIRNGGGTGKAFSQASDQIVAWRGNDPKQSLQSFVAANTSLNTPNIPLTLFHSADYYSDGPAKENNLFADYPKAQNKDSPVNTPWAGSDPQRTVKDVTSELFGNDIWNGSGTGNTSPFLDPILRNEPNNTYRTYNRYTFYRALQQLGTDTGDGRWESGLEAGGHFYYRPKLNINFEQDDPDGGYSTSADPSFTGPVGGSGTTLRRWDATRWMNYATDRLLRTEFTNGLTRWKVLTSAAWLNRTNIADDSPLGLPIITATTTNQVVRYDAQVHRLAQLAANLYDATTNRFSGNYPYLPTVFRPLVFRSAITNYTYTTNFGIVTPKIGTITYALRLFGYEEVTNNLATTLYTNWVDITNVSQLRAPGFFPTLSDVITYPKGADQAVVKTNLMRVNVYGIPWVVGAKKGFPAFNESFAQTEMEVSRRMIFTKRVGQLLRTNQTAFDLGVATNQGVSVNYLVKLTNTFAADAWNSYFAKFPPDRPLLIYVTNFVDFAVWDSSQTNANLPLGKALTLSYYRNGLRYAYTNTLRASSGNSITVGTGSKSYIEWPGRGNVGSYIPAFSNSIVTSFYITTNSFSPAYDGSFPDEAALLPLTAPVPKIGVSVTNRLLMAIVDMKANRIIDLVNLKSVSVETNIMPLLALGGTGAANNLLMPAFWQTNLYPIGGRLIQAGLSNQFGVSAAAQGSPRTGLWNPNGPPANTVEDATASLYFFLYGVIPKNGKIQYSQFVTNATLSSVRYQGGFTPSASFVLTDRRMANDPLVHYTVDDLGPGVSIAALSYNSGIPTPYAAAVKTASGNIYAPAKGNPDAKLVVNQIGQRKRVTMYAPWGTNWLSAWNNSLPTTQFDPGYKDPLIRSSDDWNFPTNYFDTVGEIGRVHRGTPWQTIYLKSPVPTNAPGNLINRFVGKESSWAAWAGHEATHPTNDWKLLQLFTTAINDNAAQGLMSVNQTNVAAWSALLSGTTVLDKTGNPVLIEPASKNLYQIVGGNSPLANPTNGVASFNAASTNRFFKHLGDLFSVPTLSVQSPYLPDWDYTQHPISVRDDIVERIPQQILPLIREDEPRFVVYSFAQTLKPAPGAIYTGPDQFFGLCTNYVVTGEYSTKTVLRFDGPPTQSKIGENSRNDFRSVVEKHELLPAPNSN